jgi:hypothetical protein
MKAKNFRWLFAGLLALAAVVWIMGQYDYDRLSDGKHPMFARWKMYEADGGSVQYWGLGYAVTEIHRMTGVIGDSDFSNLSTSKATFRVGYALDYWTPFVSRESDLLLVVTNR